MPDQIYRLVRTIVKEVLSEQESREVPYAMLRLRMVREVIKRSVYKLSEDEAGRYIDTESVGYLLQSGNSLMQQIEEQRKLLESLMVNKSG